MANHATHPESTLAETPLPGTLSGPYTEASEGRAVKSEKTRSGNPGLMARHRDTLLVTALMAALVTIFAAVIGASAYGFISVNQSLLAMEERIGGLRAEMHEEIGQVSERVTRLEERFTHVEERLTHVEERLWPSCWIGCRPAAHVEERLTLVEKGVGIEATLAILLDRLPPRGRGGCARESLNRLRMADKSRREPALLPAAA